MADVTKLKVREISMDEAVRLANQTLSGKGKYNRQREELLAKLNKNTNGKAFAIGGEDGKTDTMIEMKEGKNMAYTFTEMLKRMKIEWVVRYSGIQKALIVLPKSKFGGNV